VTRCQEILQPLYFTYLLNEHKNRHKAFIIRYRITFVRPPLWSSGQSSWLQIQKSGFDSRHYKIFGEVVDLERGPLSLVSTTEKLLGRNSSDSGVENREYGREDPLR
jgi:hypothetical protein